MRYRVTSPVADHSGRLGRLVFTNGEALAGDEHVAELDYARARGYGVEELVEQPPEEAEPDGMPKKSASTEAWRAYATAAGDLPAEQLATMSRDQLVDHYAAKEIPQ
jgi:hypothetical protein